MKRNLPCVVVDTNVLISAAILPKSKPAQLLEMLLERFVIAQSADTWTEFEAKIHLSKFDKYLDNEQRLRFMILLAQVSKFFDPKEHIAISRDKADDKFISLALVAKANMVISGDIDLKEIGAYQGIKIFAPSEAFELMQENKC